MAKTLFKLQIATGWIIYCSISSWATSFHFSKRPPNFVFFELFVHGIKIKFLSEMGSTMLKLRMKTNRDIILEIKHLVNEML